jgi:hypothetical protein
MKVAVLVKKIYKNGQPQSLCKTMSRQASQQFANGRWPTVILNTETDMKTFNCIEISCWQMGSWHVQRKLVCHMNTKYPQFSYLARIHFVVSATFGPCSKAFHLINIIGKHISKNSRLYWGWILKIFSFPNNVFQQFSLFLFQVLHLKQRVEEEKGKEKFPMKEMKLIYAGN